MGGSLLLTRIRIVKQCPVLSLQQCVGPTGRSRRLIPELLSSLVGVVLWLGLVLWKGLTVFALSLNLFAYPTTKTLVDRVLLLREGVLCCCCWLFLRYLSSHGLFCTGSYVDRAVNSHHRMTFNNTQNRSIQNFVLTHCRAPLKD